MSDTQAVMVCPGCGYDLRGAAGDRCSECGLEIDREGLGESGVPWAHRRKMGRARGYMRTVWGVVFDLRGMRYEAARPQEARDGRAFRRVTAGVVAVVLLAAWARVLIAKQGLEFLAVEPSAAWAGARAPVPDWAQDLLVPWSAGATLAWVMPASLVLLAWYVTGVQQSLFRVGKLGEEYRRRVSVIALYAAAPLVLLLPAAVCLGGAQLAGRAIGIGVPSAALAASGVVLTFCALAGTLLRVGQWVARARHAGPVIAVLAALELVALWGLGAGLFLYVVPWSVGFFRIVADSLR